MTENEAILSEEALVRLNADGWEIPAEVYESHEALRKERDEYRMAAGAEADHADEQRARAAHWYTQAAEQEDRARVEINRLDEALVAMANRAAAAEGVLHWTGSPTPHPEFLRWIADRLVEVHGENPNVDYVLSLRMRADAIEAVL